MAENSPRRRAGTLTEVAERLLESSDRLAEAIVDEIIATVSTYLEVPRESLRRSLLQHVDTAARSLTVGEVPDHVGDVSVAAERARSGIPIEHVLLAIRLSFQNLREFAVRAAAELNVESTLQLEAVRILWEVNDLVSREYAVAHRDEDLEMARTAETHRVEFVRRLVREGVNTPDMGLHAASFGLVASARYRAFRGRPERAGQAGALLAAITAWGRGHRLEPFGAVVDGEAVGVVRARPDGELPPGGPTVGLGPVVELHRAHESARVAGQMMEVGTQFGRAGPQTVENLSLLVAVASEHGVGDVLVERILGPVVAAGEFGRELVASLDAFLTADMNTAAAAELLVVHPNTLRYRLNHVKRLTGLELRSAREIGEVWWALRRREWTERNTATAQEHRDP